MSEANPTQEIKSILLWLNKAMKKCCGSDIEVLIRFCDDPISPWKPFPVTTPTQNRYHFVLIEGMGECRYWENGEWLCEDASEITDFMEIPEKNNG